MVLVYLMFVAALALAAALVISCVVRRIKQQQWIREQAQGLARGHLEMTPDDFLEMRGASFGGRGSPKYANRYNFSGVYIVLNHTKSLYYIGQGQKVFDRINSLFQGKGNRDVYADYKSGDLFTIRALSLGDSGFPTMEALKKHAVDRYGVDAQSYAKRQAPAKKPARVPEPPPVRKPRYSVTSRIKSVKQPYGGYIRPSRFAKTEYNDHIALGEDNLHPITVGLATDYLTRASLGAAPEKAFQVSLIGAQIAGEEAAAAALLKLIDGLSDASIAGACQLSGFDVCYRAGKGAYTKPYHEICPDEQTIHNIRTMVNRSLSFFEEYGPITKDGFTFEGGYTATVTSGDGDFLTADTIWDFKVSVRPPTSAHTLQLLMYYIMGCHSIHPEFRQIAYLGIFNPRLNHVYRFRLSELSPDIISEVETAVIGYEAASAHSIGP